METSYDKDGDIKVKDRVSCFVLLPSEKKDKIKLLVQFGFKPGSSELHRLQAVNRINSDYIIVKATVRDNDTLQMEWDILLDGGITKKAFVLAIKRFCSIPHDAVADCADDVVE